MSFAFDGLFFFYLSYFQYNIFQRSIVSHIIQKSRNFFPVVPVGLYDFCNSRLYSSKLRVDLFLPRTTFLQNFSGLFLSIRTFSNFLFGSSRRALFIITLAEFFRQLFKCWISPLFELKRRLKLYNILIFGFLEYFYTIFVPSSPQLCSHLSP